MTDYAELIAPATLEFERKLPGPLQRVWDHIVDPDLRARWIAAGAIDGRVGGTIRFDFDHRRLSESAPPEKYADAECASFEGDIEVFDPPHKIAFTWPDVHYNDKSLVTITLRELDDGVLLRLRHERLEAPSQRLETAAGWHAHFELLADVLAGRPARDFWQLDAALERAYAERFR